MDNKVSDILMQRTNQLMAERYITKKEMAERLDMEYLTFWRKLKGKRGIDVVLLMKIANTLGTSASYLLGETDNPSLPSSEINDAREHFVIQTNDPSREIITKPSYLTFKNGETTINIPDTPANKKWFDEFLAKAFDNSAMKDKPTVATA